MQDFTKRETGRKHTTVAVKFHPDIRDVALLIAHDRQLVEYDTYEETWEVTGKVSKKSIDKAVRRALKESGKTALYVEAPEELIDELESRVRKLFGE